MVHVSTQVFEDEAKEIGVRPCPIIFGSDLTHCLITFKKLYFFWCNYMYIIQGSDCGKREDLFCMQLFSCKSCKKILSESLVKFDRVLIGR